MWLIATVGEFEGGTYARREYGLSADQPLLNEPGKQQAGDGGELIEVRAVEPAQLGNFCRGDRGAARFAGVTAQSHLDSCRFAIGLSAELADKAQGIGLQGDGQLLFNLADQCRLVALPRFPLAARDVIDVLAVGAGAEQLLIFKGESGEFVDH